MKIQSENTLKSLATALFLVSFTLNLGAQGTEFTYNGQLTENGVPFNGLVELEATLWDAATNGNQITSGHTLPQLVELKKGLFTVVLDFGKDAFPGPPRWVQIALRKDPDPEPFTTLWPRQKITAVPYAMTAEEITGKVPVGGLFGGYSNALTFDNPGNFFAGQGSGLLNLNASQLTSGTVPEAALANVWKLGGNAGTSPGTHFLGTTDNQPLDFKVNGVRALRLEDNGDSSDSGTVPDGAPNVIGGSPHNFVATGVVGAAIGGGGATNNFGFPFPNSVLADFGVVAGGLGNTIGSGSFGGAIGGGANNSITANSRLSIIAGGGFNDIVTNSEYSAIGGGLENGIAANSDYAAIGGGAYNNIAVNAAYATIPGGESNFATNRAFAAGTRALARHTGAFVWADSQNGDFPSTLTNQFAQYANVLKEVCHLVRCFFCWYRPEIMKEQPS